MTSTHEKILVATVSVLFAALCSACGIPERKADPIKSAANRLVLAGHGELVNVRDDKIGSTGNHQVWVYKQMPDQNGLCAISGASVVLDRGGHEIEGSEFTFTHYALPTAAGSCSVVSFDRFGSKDAAINTEELFAALAPVERCLFRKSDVDCVSLGQDSLSAADRQALENAKQNFSQSIFVSARRIREKLVLQYVLPGSFCRFVSFTLMNETHLPTISRVGCAN